MKKLFFLLITLSLVSCTSYTTKRDLMLKYNRIYDNFINAKSYEIQTLSNTDLIYKEDNQEVDTGINGKFIINYDTNKYYVTLNFLKSNHKTSEWYDNGVIYLQDDDFKHMYSESLDNLLYHLSEIFNFKLIDLISSDIEKIDYNKKDTYKIKLSKSGIHKLVEINNLFGYGESFDYKNGQIEMILTLNNDNLDKISFKGELIGEINQKEATIKIEEEHKYLGINSSEVTLPINIDSFKEKYNEYERPDSNKEKFINYLIESDYKNDLENIYTLEFNGENIIYKYDFNEKTNTLLKDGVEYKYYWETDMGISDSCKYSFTKNKSIEETKCSENQVINLYIAKENVMYDLSMSQMENN